MIEDFENRSGERSQLLRRFLTRLALALVDHLEHLLPALFRHALSSQEIDPEFAIADPNHHIFRAETECAQDVDTDGDELDIGLDRGFADDVAVILKMFAQTSALLLLVTETLRDGEPLRAAS